MADALAVCLDGLEFVHSAARRLHSGDSGPVAAEDLAGQPLGNFRIVREVGRGGMGVVYEAERLSLRWRVALKVLPMAATMDARHLQRFKIEAQAAALLHHPHIVPVFAVGNERGVHFTRCSSSTASRSPGSSTSCASRRSATNPNLSATRPSPNAPVTLPLSRTEICPPPRRGRLRIC